MKEARRGWASARSRTGVFALLWRCSTIELRRRWLAQRCSGNGASDIHDPTIAKSLPVSTRRLLTNGTGWATVLLFSRSRQSSLERGC